MAKQFLRKCVLSLSGSTSLSIPGGGPTDLKIEGAIGASTTQNPDPARFRITNPNPQTIATFKNKEFQQIQFDAGYESNCAQVYVGDIRQSIYAHSDNVVDSYIDIFAGTNGNAYQQGRVSTTLAAGWTPMDKVNVALKGMAPHGITGLGLTNVDLSKPASPRGAPFFGMARDLIREVALSAGAVWWMNGDGKVNIVDHSKPLQSNSPVVLNSKTGMVSFAHQTESGVVVRCLINPAIKIGTQINLDESSVVQAEKDNTPTGDSTTQNINLNNTGRIAADGMYRVLYSEIEFDSRGQVWWMTITCLAMDASAKQSQISAGMVKSQF